ncbi:hypothetical protein H7I40_25860 [Mycolicibacterium madagascariense]|nr:hypothetical protein [Mycolicibacterium madagascariense]
MRFAFPVLALFLGIMASSPIPAHATPPPAPDLRGYAAVPPDAFAMGNEAYFQTPDGLLCAILPDRGMAGCDGRLPATADGVDEIALTPDPATRGLRATGDHVFVKSTGDAAPVLREGQKIAFGDFECAVGAGAFTACTRGTPAAQWMVVSPGGTRIGPVTAGLPPGFPDPNDFVVGDETYLVGQGAKNAFPVFTVDGGLTCSMMVANGGEIGCDGRLPGVRTGDDEVFAQVPGTVGTRRANPPRFTTPAYPGQVQRLPVGHRVEATDGTCMAIEGGVACVGRLAGDVRGFQVTRTGVRTVGG